MHPAPQLRRPDWFDLTGRWGFAHDDADVGLSQGWHERPDPFSRVIEVPYPPESRLSGIHDAEEHPVVWYRRQFRLSEVPGFRRGRRLLLKVGAIDYSACIWVNGKFLTRHEGGHSSFTVDLTEALEDGDEQVLVIRAEDQPRDLTQPRGKQYWESRPADIWYYRTTGIWQPIWLEAVDRTYVEHLAWTPDSRRGRVGVAIRLDRPPDREMHMRLRLSIDGAVLADDSYLVQHQESGREVRLEPAVDHLHRNRVLWSPSHPNLIDAEVILQDADGNVIDVVLSYVGLRSIQAADGLFLLNGRPSYLRMVLAQGYWPDSLLAAPSSDALRHEVEMIKALGFNGVRIHQKVEDPRFLYWCDRLGLLVWAEMANAYAFTENAVKRFTTEWLDVVRRDYSHPSIVTWVPFNESWGVPDLPGDAAQRDFVRGIYHLTKAIDPTRPVIANDGWEHLVGDIWGIHDYALDGAVLRDRYGTPEALDEALQGRPQYHRAVLDPTARAGQPVVLSEFGGITFTPQPGVPWFGYGSVANEGDFMQKYEDLLDAVLDSTCLAGFCYTQLADTEQETNGLLHADRTPKMDLEVIRAINRRPSRAIPGDFIRAAQAASKVLAYSSSAADPQPADDGAEVRPASAERGERSVLS
jgi:hypothetical protein